MNELGYEIDESFVDDDFNDSSELELDQEDEKDDKTPVRIQIVAGLLIGVLIGYGVGYYENSLKEAENLILLNDCSSKINAQQFLVSNCENTRAVELNIRQNELNLTSKCWSDLTLANYEISVLKGYNFTKPALIKQLDKDREDFKELNERYYELEKKLGLK